MIIEECRGVVRKGTLAFQIFVRECSPGFAWDEAQHVGTAHKSRRLP